MPTDPCHYDYQPYEYEYPDGGGADYEYEYADGGKTDYYQDSVIFDQEASLPEKNPEEAFMSDEICSEEASCESIDNCLDHLDDPDAPEKQIDTVCGFDEEKSLLKICCPKSKIKEPEENPTQPPRFPQRGKPRPVSDKTSMCRTWAKNGACKLDQHFSYGVQPFEKVSSKDMFDFMTKACLKSCERAPNGNKIIDIWYHVIFCHHYQVVMMSIPDVKSGRAMVIV